VPLAALALRALGRWSWTHLGASVGAIWGVKLVATVALYLVFARGAAVELQPAVARRATATVVESGYQPAPGAFAAGQPVGGGAARIVVQATGVATLRCDIHPHEQATVVVVDHPYAALTGADGRFHLDEAPAGLAMVTALAYVPGGVARAMQTAVIPAGGRAE